MASRLKAGAGGGVMLRFSIMLAPLLALIEPVADARYFEREGRGHDFYTCLYASMPQFHALAGWRHDFELRDIRRCFLRRRRA